MRKRTTKEQMNKLLELASPVIDHPLRCRCKQCVKLNRYRESLPLDQNTKLKYDRAELALSIQALRFEDNSLQKCSDKLGVPLGMIQKIKREYHLS